MIMAWQEVAELSIYCRDPGPRRAMPMPTFSGLHSRGYLPHLKVEGGTYFVTFRLADSLPQDALERLAAWRVDQLRRFASGQSHELDARFSTELDEQLDRGGGACWLNDARVARHVAESLRHFDRAHYRLHAWVLMPNHVHALVQPLPGHALEEILQSWQSSTAHLANKTLGRTGAFWQPESYDHWVRNETERAHYRRYIEENPVKARLCGQPHDWPWSSAREK